MERCRREEPPLFPQGGEREVACWLYAPEERREALTLERLKSSFFESTVIHPSVKGREPLLEVEGLRKHFQTRGHWGEHAVVRAVDDVSFDIYPGETLGLVGESGCGKTTTGKVIVGLEDPTEGTITYKGTPMATLSPEKRREVSRSLQMVFQDPYSSLNPRMTVKEIVGEGLEIHGLAPTETALREKVGKALEDSGLRPEVMNRYPHEFSGGQRQRIGIARALAMDPELIVCDEPVSALDVSIQAQVINLLQELQSEHNLTFLFVAHDLSVVRHISDRVVVMYLGHVMEMAPTDTLFDAYRHPYTEALLSAVPEPRPKKESSRIILSGDVPSPIDPPSGCPFHTRCQRKKGPVCEKQAPPLREVGDRHSVACWWYTDGDDQT
ncbi:MAG: ATP-binding cassette domain-containing protein [Synergistales bacterium]|nr:ATP-binding cassette domain-containing protein [Synergistales bacterium]